MSTSSFYGENPTPTEYRDLDTLIADAEAAAAVAQTAGAGAQTSANDAAASAAQAASSAAASGTSASSASSSAVTASTANTNAQTAATNAATSATAANNSAIAAANSATSAATSASNAATSSASAANSAASATASAASATTSATNAATSATNSATSAATANTKATQAATSATNAATSETNAAAYELSANNWATKTSGPVAGGEYSAKYHAQAAASSASGAASSASAASSSASTASAASTAAGAAQVAAETARDQTLAAYDNFDDRYLGAKTSDPTVDNDGNALIAGTLYFNSTLGYMKVYTGSVWVDAYAAGTSFLAKANNLSDLPSASTARTNLGLGTAATQNTSAFAAASHTHPISDVTNLQSSLDGKAALSHVHAIADVTNLQTSLDAKLNTSATTYVQQSGVTGSAYLPAGTTAQRPASPAAGYIRYNSTTGKFEGYGSAWGNIGGGAAIGDTPPANPGAGDLWWNSADGRMYVYYTDANSSQWVDLNAGGAGQYLPLTGGTVTGDVIINGNVGFGQMPTSYGATVRTVEANLSGVSAYTLMAANTTSVKTEIASSESSLLGQVGTRTNHPLVIKTNDTERLRVDSSGNLGIGTTSPNTYATGLTISNTGSQQLALVSTSTSQYSGPGLLFSAANATGNFATYMQHSLNVGSSDLTDTAFSMQQRTATGGFVGTFYTYNHKAHTHQFFSASGGGTERMRIDASGRVTMPYQPRFSGYGWPYHTQGAYSSTGIVITPSAANLNDGSCWNFSTHRFTAPVSGRYRIFFTGMTTANNNLNVGARINGSSVVASSYTSGSASYLRSVLETFVLLAANDYIQLVVFEGSLHEGWGSINIELIG